MIKEPRVDVDKVWGSEIWFVNSDKYCGKLLVVDRDATCSYHCHIKKEETFFAIEGYVKLTVEGKDYILAPFTKAKTIKPGEYHQFHGITEAVILEVSTHHEDSDVKRSSESQPGQESSGTP